MLWNLYIVLKPPAGRFLKIEIQPEICWPMCCPAEGMCPSKRLLLCHPPQDKNPQRLKAMGLIGGLSNPRRSLSLIHLFLSHTKALP